MLTPFLRVHKKCKVRLQPVVTLWLQFRQSSPEQVEILYSRSAWLSHCWRKFCCTLYSEVTFMATNHPSCLPPHQEWQKTLQVIDVIVDLSSHSLSPTHTHRLISTGISLRLLLLECSKCSLLMHVRASFFHLQHLIYRPVVPLILCRAISSAPQIALSKPPHRQIKRKVIAIVWLQIHQCWLPFFLQLQIKGPSCPRAPLITGLVSLCEWTPGLLHFHPQIGFQREPPRAGLLRGDPHTLHCAALLLFAFSAAVSLPASHTCSSSGPLQWLDMKSILLSLLLHPDELSLSLLRRSDPQVC